MLNNENTKNPAQRNYPLLLLGLLALVVVVITSGTIGASMQEAHKERISVNDPRPVCQAAETLEKKYGWIVTYEDPPFAHESDVLDVTEKVGKDPSKFKTQKVIIPKGGELTLEYDIDPVSQKPVAADLVVQQLLDTYNMTNPGAFRLERDGQRLHIIGASARNKEGVLTAHQSVLDASITISAQKRNGLTLLAAFCDAVSQASHTPIRIGMVPINLLARYESEAGAKDEKARDFLVNELDRMTGRARLSWHLLYSPDTKAYYLNIHAAV